MDELLPCPFCGHDSPEFERMGTRRQSCIVICGHCGARHESSDEDAESGSSWNQRAAVAAQPEAVGEQSSWQQQIYRARENYWVFSPDSVESLIRTALASAPTIQPTQPVQEREAMHGFSREDLELIASDLEDDEKTVNVGPAGGTDGDVLIETHTAAAARFIRAALASPAQAGDAGEPSDGERAIAGALFDFLGFLTTSERQWTFSSYDEASPAVEALEEWAKKRNLSLDEADVSGWSAAIGAKGGQK